MRAKKSLGQNFLQNRGVVDVIIRASDISSGDTVLEIGPGKGILTESLLEKAKKVIAVEKDNLLHEFLKEKFKKEISEKKLDLIHGDILETELNLPTNYKLVANIPYNITGEILKMFLSKDNQPNLIIFLVQYEVAERIVSTDDKESILSISVKAYGDPRVIKKVKRGNFLPQPKVDSAILLIKKISKDFFENIDEQEFFKVVKMGFSQKRKMLGNNLKPVLGEKLKEILKNAQISPKLRAEDLSLADWKKILREKK